MPAQTDITDLSVTYKVSTSSGDLEIHETLEEAYLSCDGLHVIYRRATGSADVEISALIGDDSGERALRALCDFHAILAEWDENFKPVVPQFALDLYSLALGVWMDLERAISAANSLHRDLQRDEETRILRAKWLEDLPNGTPLLLTGSRAYFFEHEDDEESRLGHIFLLDTAKGRPALYWPDGSRWRDFRTSREDNGAKLASAKAVEDASDEFDILLPDGFEALAKRAEVIARMHGEGPRLPHHEGMIALKQLPSLQEWLAGFSFDR